MRNIMVGYELNNTEAQISYFDYKNMEPITLSTVVGTKKYQIPTVICKKTGEDIWYYGREAIYFSQQKEGVLVQDLFTLCYEGKEVEIEGVKYSGVKLLSIFISLSFTLLKNLGTVDQIKGITFTSKEVETPYIHAIQGAMELLNFDRKRYFIQDHKESFYYFIMNQKKELWSHEVYYFEFEKDKIKTYNLRINRKYLPMIVSVEELEDLGLGKDPSHHDEIFYQYLQKLFYKKVVTSIFLIGEDFHQSWAPKSTEFMCKGRKVFLGQNLYSKGACYGVREKLEEKILRDFFYNGQNMLHVNVGIDMTVRGITSYYSLIEAGVNWYEAYHRCEFILDDTEEVILQFDTVDKKSSQCIIHLDGLPKRPNKATRVALSVMFLDSNTCKITVEDLGLGMLYLATNKKWEQVVTI